MQLRAAISYASREQHCSRTDVFIRQNKVTKVVKTFQLLLSNKL